jgi:hypothetical protein
MVCYFRNEIALLVYHLTASDTTDIILVSALEMSTLIEKRKNG